MLPQPLPRDICGDGKPVVVKRYAAGVYWDMHYRLARYLAFCLVLFVYSFPLPAQTRLILLAQAGNRTGGLFNLDLRDKAGLVQLRAGLPFGFDLLSLTKPPGGTASAEVSGTSSLQGLAGEEAFREEAIREGGPFDLSRAFVRLGAATPSILVGAISPSNLGRLLFSPLAKDPAPADKASRPFRLDLGGGSHYGLVLGKQAGLFMVKPISQAGAEPVYGEAPPPPGYPSLNGAWLDVSIGARHTLWQSPVAALGLLGAISRRDIKERDQWFGWFEPSGYIAWLSGSLEARSATSSLIFAASRMFGLPGQDGGSLRADLDWRLPALSARVTMAFSDGAYKNPAGRVAPLYNLGALLSGKQTIGNPAVADRPAERGRQAGSQAAYVLAYALEAEQSQSAADKPFRLALGLKAELSAVRRKSVAGSGWFGTLALSLAIVRQSLAEAAGSDAVQDNSAAGLFSGEDPAAYLPAIWINLASPELAVDTSYKPGFLPGLHFQTAWRQRDGRSTRFDLALEYKTGDRLKVAAAGLLRFTEKGLFVKPGLDLSLALADSRLELKAGFSEPWQLDSDPSAWPAGGNPGSGSPGGGLQAGGSPAGATLAALPAAKPLPLELRLSWRASYSLKSKP